MLFKKYHIENLALETLRKCYGANYEIPIDIELVMEKSGYFKKIGLLEGLKSVFSVVAALYPAKTGNNTVIVDQDEFDSHSVLLRISLAYILGEVVLQEDEQNADGNDAKEAKEGDGCLEHDKAVDYFADAVLMPMKYLSNVVCDCYAECAEQYDFDDSKILSYIAMRVAKKFYVSFLVADQRLADLGLTDQIKDAAENKNLYLF